MKMMGVESHTQTAFGMRYSAEAIMKNKYEYGAKDGKELHILIKTFMDAVNPVNAGINLTQTPVEI